MIRCFLTVLRWLYYAVRFFLPSRRIQWLDCSSCQASNAQQGFSEICEAVNERLKRKRAAFRLRARFSERWQDRYSQIESGELKLCWLCGLPYVLEADGQRRYDLLCAPVMAAQRYNGRPIYFSDVVVSSNSSYYTLADLEDCTFSYNEPGSQSGVGITSFELEKRGMLHRFGKVVEAGSHQRSIEMILSGDVDASAIDSTVLETELLRDPLLASRIRVVAVFGPSSIPPLVVHESVPQETREALCRAFCELEASHASTLRRHGYLRFVEVRDADYDDIRRMSFKSANVEAWTK